MSGQASSWSRQSKWVSNSKLDLTFSLARVSFETNVSMEKRLPKRPQMWPIENRPSPRPRMG